MIRAIRFGVRELIGEYSHRISLEPGQPLSIAYGPNGVGKTRFLELIKAMLDGDSVKVSSIQFQDSIIEFSDDSYLTCFRFSHEDVTQVDWELYTTTYDEAIRWSAHVNEFDRLGVAAPPSWISLNDHTYMDRTDGEVITEEEFAERFSRYPFAGEVTQPPSRAKEFLLQHPCYLIGIQRLIQSSDPSLATRRRRGTARRSSQERTTIDLYSEDIKDRLSEALLENSRKSQSLDRTFPRRLLAESTTSLSEEEIRTQYARQNRKRELLAQLGLISPEPELPLPETKSLVEWQRIVLGTYIKDTDERLGAFDEVLSKATLLEDIVNRRFLRKYLQVNAADGLVVRKHPSDQRIPTRALSSGEQHEMIMFYDLLFRVAPNAIVLIDEPEISLHISWQRHFVQDILRVLDLSGSRAIVATHSPQIIGKWRSLTTELGPFEVSGDDE